MSSIIVRVVSGWSWLKFEEEFCVLFEDLLYSMLLMSAKTDRVAKIIVIADKICAVNDFCWF